MGLGHDGCHILQVALRHHGLLQVIGVGPLHPVLAGGVADDLPLLGGIHMAGVDPKRHPVLLPQSF